MKYLKLFENYMPVDFKVGDYVYAIDIADCNNELQEDTKYQIIKIYSISNPYKDKQSSTDPMDLCNIKTKNGFEKYQYFLRRFLKEDEYPIYLDAKKYNL
jgi:hypothetical protein